jgi:glycine cleavage system H protein
MNVPDDLKFAPTHEWLRPSDGAVGISDHAQAELTDIVFVDLPKVGTKVTAGGAAAVVESVKAASDIYSPVSGEVIETNPALADNPALVNTDPYGEGWLFKLSGVEDAGASALLDAEAYRKHLAQL